MDALYPLQLPGKVPLADRVGVNQVEVRLRYRVLHHSLAVSTVQPVGMPLGPDTSHVAALFLTNVPVFETPESQLFVLYEGVEVNIALTYLKLGQFWNIEV